MSVSACTWKAATGHLTPLCPSWGQTAVWAHPPHLWRTLVKDHVMKPVMFPGEGGSKVFIFYRIKVTTQFYETISTAYHKSWQRSTLFWSRTRSKTPLPCLCPGSCIYKIYTRTLDKYTFKVLTNPPDAWEEFKKVWKYAKKHGLSKMAYFNRLKCILNTTLFY